LGALERLAERLHVPITDLLGENELETRPVRYGEPRESALERISDENEARLRQAQVLYYQGKLNDAVELLMGTSVQRLSQRETALSHLQLAQCYLALERGEDARREAAQGVIISERLGDLELTERLRTALGEAYARLHSPELALEQFRAALASLDTAEDYDSSFRLELLTSAGTQAIVIGQIDQAIAYLQEAAAVAADVAEPERLGSAYWALSEAHRARNDHAQARYYAVRSIAAFEEGRTRTLVTSAFSRLGRALALNNQESDALQRLNTAHEFAAAQHDISGMAEVERNLASVYLQQHLLDDALSTSKSALAHAETTSDKALQADALLVLARVHETRDEAADANASYERAIALLTETGATERLRTAYEQFSAFLESRGEKERAFDMLKQAYRTSGRAGAAI
jgi:tetratricopeptide (TPR) repeat protein